jgi:hypothetical protein
VLVQLLYLKPTYSSVEPTLGFARATGIGRDPFGATIINAATSFGGSTAITAPLA